MSRAFATVAALMLSAACMHSGKPGRAPGDPTPSRPSAGSSPEVQAIMAFTARLREYTALHDRLEKTLPPLPRETTPQVVDTHQRALTRLLSEHRKGARRGDLFTPEGEVAIRTLLAKVFNGPGGDKLKSTIMDENPVAVALAVNGRYPDGLPVSTMPPEVLAVLPKLPDDLEYRFIGRRLILLDVHAHTVADYIVTVLPQ